MNVSRETISGNLIIMNQLGSQIMNMMQPIRNMYPEGCTEWWEWEEMIERNRMLINSCQESIKTIQQNVSRETSDGDTSE